MLYYCTVVVLLYYEYSTVYCLLYCCSSASFAECTMFADVFAPTALLCLSFQP